MTMSDGVWVWWSARTTGRCSRRRCVRPWSILNKKGRNVQYKKKHWNAFANFDLVNNSCIFIGKLAQGYFQHVATSVPRHVSNKIAQRNSWKSKFSHQKFQAFFFFKHFFSSKIYIEREILVSCALQSLWYCIWGEIFALARKVFVLKWLLKIYENFQRINNWNSMIFEL